MQKLLSPALSAPSVRTKPRGFVCARIALLPAPPCPPAGARGSVCQLAYAHQPHRVPVSSQLPAHPAAQPPQCLQAPQHEGKRGIPTSHGIQRTSRSRVASSQACQGPRRRQGLGWRDACCATLRSVLLPPLLRAQCSSQPVTPWVLFVGWRDRDSEGLWGISSPPPCTFACTAQ